jgi:hypothetical protein
MRRQTAYLILLYAAISLAGPQCVKPFNPPALQEARNYLVVEGVAIPGGDSTVITLSRTKDLTDTVIFQPEKNASVRVESTNGTAYLLQETAPGTYKALLTLDPAQTWRLRIRTSLGQDIVSSYETVVETPPIDSLHWKQDGDVTIYADTRDRNNKTRYYRWEFRETWEYRSFYDSQIGYDNGLLFYLDSTQKTYRCWDSAVSTSVILGTSEKLGDDVILDQQITVIPRSSIKISAIYAIDVFQYGLNRDAFIFWDEIRKNGSETGGLFDPQPSQLPGNLVNTSDPTQPVIGYFSIASRQRARLFIWNNQVVNWPPEDISVFCTPIITTADSAIYYLFRPELRPAYFITGGGLAIANVRCVDCRLQGGTNRKPANWPQ